jgi:divalent anion:Na+ symporter, DASS family
MTLNETHRRLIAHSAFRDLPDSFVRLWLASATLHPIHAGERWHEVSAPSACLRVWLAGDTSLPLRFAGLEGLFDTTATPVTPLAPLAQDDLQRGWLLLLPLAPLRQAMLAEPAIAKHLTSWLALPDGDVVCDTEQRARQPYDWLMAVALPAALWFGLPQVGLSTAAASYLASVSLGLWVWLRQLAPPFVGALLILTSLVLTSSVSTAIVFAGFADRTIFLLIGVLALGYVTQVSGLAQRLTLMLLRRIPQTVAGYHAGLLALGFGLTLILPSSAARINLISAITGRLGQRFRAAHSPFAHLGVAALSGVTAISTVFLTSNPVNFLVLGLLPEQWQQHFGWAAWAQASLGFLVPFLIGYGVLFWFLTRGAGPHDIPLAPPLPPGQWKRDELVAVSAIGLFAVGVAGINLHHIAIPLAALGVYLWLTSYGLLGENTAEPQVHWPMVLYLTAMIGLVRAFNDLGLEQDLSRALNWLPALANWNPPVFLMVLMAITVVLRLFLPTLVCVSVLCVMLIPMTAASHVNPWLIAFVAATTAEGWFLPYQSSDYQMFRAGVGPILDREHGDFIKQNAIVQGIKLLALMAAIPYWQWLGIL